MQNFIDSEFSQAIYSASSLQGAQISENYIDTIRREIDNLNQNLNKKGYTYANQQPNIVGGFIAEDWHAGTFNIHAAVKDKIIRAEVPSSNTLGSPDIILSNQEKYSSKYIRTHSKSVQEQATSYAEYHQRKGNGSTFEKWMKERNLSTDLKEISIYQEQGRIIPSEQLENAKAYLEKIIAESPKGEADRIKRAQETLSQVNDRIRSTGVESRPLSKEASTRIAKHTQDGKYSSADDGITLGNSLRNHPKSLLKKSFKTGFTTASITMALEVSPELLKIIKANIEGYGYNYSDFIDKLGDTGQKGVDSFLLGTITAYLINSSESGLLGEAFKNISSEMIAGTTLIIFTSIKATAAYSKGNITKSEMAHQITTQTIGIIGAAVGSAAFQFLPVIGTLVGSLVGSIIANSVYNQVNKLLLAFAIENGCTFFNIVDQSYQLPDNILKELGYDVMDSFDLEFDEFNYDTLVYDEFEYDTVIYDEVDIKFVKRGIISISKIGYI